MSNTIAQQTAAYFTNLVNIYYDKLGCQGSTTTFDLYRRTNTGSPDDLGVPSNALQKIYAAQPVVFAGLMEIREGAFGIAPEGQLQFPMIDAITALIDVQSGDTLVMAIDNRGWGVERAERFGSLMVLVLDRAASQI